jgi:formylglycine-generating enzyme required for sulfatase activity
MFASDTGYAGSTACRIYKRSKADVRAKGGFLSPGFKQGDKDPVVCVSSEDAMAYAKWLEKGAGHAFRLPTEAEFEYALRGGTTGLVYWGNNHDDACVYGNVADRQAEGLPYLQGLFDSQRWSFHACDDHALYTAPVASYRPNPFGLYDMLGNVYEWTQDCYHMDYRGAPLDGSARLGSAQDCGQIVVRGAAWDSPTNDTRSASRMIGSNHFGYNNVGFRLVQPE